MTEASKWVPTVIGSEAEGQAEYHIQTGLYYIQGALITCFFDVQWSYHTGKGVMEIVLPYAAIKAEGFPFCGVVETSDAIVWAPNYLSIMLALPPGSNKAYISQYSSSKWTDSIGVNEGGRIKGTIQYLISN